MRGLSALALLWACSAEAPQALPASALDARPPLVRRVKSGPVEGLLARPNDDEEHPGYLLVAEVDEKLKERLREQARRGRVVLVIAPGADEGRALAYLEGLGSTGGAAVVGELPGL